MLQYRSPRVTTPNEGRYIYLAVTAKRNRRSTTSDRSRQLSSATGTTVSRQTVYRSLGYIGLYARRPVRCVPLTATRCHLRLTWKKAIRGFTSGRPRGTTPADDRYIVFQDSRNRRQTTGEIARHTTKATGRPISHFTVARRLHGGGLFIRRPVRCVPLTPAHRRRRSLWCREHRNWRDNEWGRVLFTDESRFSLSSDSHRILIWRERGSRNHPPILIERDRYGGHGVLVWGGIMLGSRTDIHIFDAGPVIVTRFFFHMCVFLEALWVCSSFSWTTMHHVIAQ
ncbi:transposable element Tc3 transposase [Trichonephila clavipes]|nr:transposable element Tc3 transposase [Trichonephila clavipes]